MREYIVSVMMPDGSIGMHTLDADNPEVAANTILKNLGIGTKLKRTEAGDMCNVFVQANSSSRATQTCFTYSNTSTGGRSKVVANIALISPQGTPFALSNITDNVVEFKSAINKSTDVAGVVSAVNMHKKEYDLFEEDDEVIAEHDIGTPLNY